MAQQRVTTAAMADQADNDKQVIEFYSTQGEYGCFSNFSRHHVNLKDKHWPTTEHYFQAQKFPDTKHEEDIRLTKSSSVAARKGRSRQRPLRTDWEAVKDSIMREAVLAKFKQHKDIRKILLDTGDAVLVEHTKRDSYWGDGGDGSGRNELGKILMSVRQQLKEEEVT